MKDDAQCCTSKLISDGAANETLLEILGVSTAEVSAPHRSWFLSRPLWNNTVNLSCISVSSRVRVVLSALGDSGGITDGEGPVP